MRRDVAKALRRFFVWLLTRDLSVKIIIVIEKDARPKRIQQTLHFSPPSFSLI